MSFTSVMYDTCVGQYVQQLIYYWSLISIFWSIQLVHGHNQISIIWNSNNNQSDTTQQKVYQIFLRKRIRFVIIIWKIFLIITNTAIIMPCIYCEVSRKRKNKILPKVLKSEKGVLYFQRIILFLEFFKCKFIFGRTWFMSTIMMNRIHQQLFHGRILWKHKMIFRCYFRFKLRNLNMTDLKHKLMYKSKNQS